MKKVLLLLVSLLVLGTLTACSTKGPAGELVIGTPPLNGDFVIGFGNSAYDRIVTDMLWGSDTYQTTPGGEFKLNDSVVKSVETALDAAGNKTYTYTLKSDLKWSDGEPITAADYVFGALLTNSPAWEAVEGNILSGNSLVGWKEYSTGASASFTGVKWLADDSFAVTISAEELPYFYEVVYAAMSPLPLHVYANGAKIAADGSSLAFDGEALTKETAKSDEAVIGDVHADLAEVATYVNTKERRSPSVTAGPFRFVSFANDTATVENNPHYAGDYRGEKAKLEKVLVKRVNESLDVDYVISGEIDITTGVVEGAKIEKAKANEDKVAMVDYPRSGYGFLSFHTDFGPTAEPEVRQAMAYSIDRQVFVSQILEGYGVLVNGEYGLSQWMYEVNKDKINENLINYVYNPEEANKLLDQSTYKFESDGATAFDASKASATYLRHNAAGEPLVVNHLGSSNNPITDLIGTELPAKLEKVGMKFTLESQDFAAMLQFYQKPDTQAAAYGARKFHTFNLASSFTAVFDPYTSYSKDYLGTPYNATQTNDDTIDALTKKLRSIDPENKDEYADVWYEYQVYWNSFLPVIPLYSNQYFDIFNVNVKNVTTSPVYLIGRAAIDITVD